MASDETMETVYGLFPIFCATKNYDNLKLIFDNTDLDANRIVDGIPLFVHALNTNLQIIQTLFESHHADIELYPNAITHILTAGKQRTDVYERIEYLISVGAPVGLDMVIYAIEHRKSLIPLFFKYYNPVSTIDLVYCIQSNVLPEAIEILLIRGLDPNITGDTSPLQIAIAISDAMMVHTLLEYGACPNAYTPTAVPPINFVFGVFGGTRNVFNMDNTNHEQNALTYMFRCEVDHNRSAFVYDIIAKAKMLLMAGVTIPEWFVNRCDPQYTHENFIIQHVASCKQRDEFLHSGCEDERIALINDTTDTKKLLVETICEFVIFNELSDEFQLPPELVIDITAYMFVEHCWDVHQNIQNHLYQHSNRLYDD